jgi:CheY-like chemotaxis protein
MPGGGRLTVEVTNAALDAAYVRDLDGVAAGQYVLIAVSDTGEGMAPEVVARAFEPFFSTKGEGRGSGLGLSMVYGFARQSGGHARIYSEPGQGTTVKIYLPRTQQAVKPITPISSLPARGGAETILVVEDEAAVRAAAVDLLEGLGYRCIQAADAAAALEILGHDDAVVDLIFSDVVMPGPVTIREFAQKVAALRRPPPILFTSGYSENAIVHHGRLDEGVTLLSKPYARDDLAAKVAQVLAGAKAA